MQKRLVFIVMTALPQLCSAAGQEVGEWARDISMCDQSRIAFTADGRHEPRVLEDGSWRSLASAAYRREENALIVENAELTEQLEVLEESSERMVLRNASAKAERETAVAQVELVRCPDAP